MSAWTEAVGRRKVACMNHDTLAKMANHAVDLIIDDKSCTRNQFRALLSILSEMREHAFLTLGEYDDEPEKDN